MRIGITTSSSNNFDLSAIYTSTILLIPLWLFFHYCLSACLVMGIGITNPGSGWIELLEEVLSKYSATNSTSAIDMNIMSELDDGSPLTIACELGNLDVINMLLKHNADPNVYNNLSTTALCFKRRQN